MAKGSGGGGRNKGGGGGGGNFTRGSFVTDGMVRGLVVGRGTLGGRNKIPATKLDIGGGRTTVVPTSQLRSAFTGSARRSR